MEEIKQRIVVASDSHGDDKVLEKIVNYEKNNFNGNIIFLHCGDICSNNTTVWECVRGNMDFSPNLPTFKIIPVYKHIIFMTHGHYFSKYEIDEMIDSNYCDICLSGHTHIPSKLKVGHIWYINPGSTSRPRGESKRQYCTIDIDAKGKIKISYKLIEDID